MTGEQWQRVRDLFEAIVDMEPADARRHVAAASIDDVVRAEVLSLLEHHSHAGDFLHASASLSEAGLGARDLLTGTVLGQYTVVRELGHGGMGRVYLARDERLQREVCLKAVRPDLSNPAFRVRLQREARTAASLTHPGICAVYAFEEFEGDPYLVTEFIDGHTLRREIESGDRPSPDALISTLDQLAAAVGAAHAKGVVHRDLKPENIMRAFDGRLKVLDFGVARAHVGKTLPDTLPQTLPGALVGTVAYMAPEQLQGEPVDARADVFALGVVLYELATGVHPFAAPTSLGTAARVLAHDPEPLGTMRPDLPHGIVAAIDRCLAKRPELRFGSAAELAAALERPSPVNRRATDRLSWWRLHQFVALALYLTGAILAWQIKEWQPGQWARWAFLATGVLTATAGVMRGHLLFTERVQPDRLAPERERTRTASFGLDLLIALLLILDGSLLSSSHPVAGALVMGLAAGIATAAVFIEPSTSRAAIGVP
jgi:hypothetical protein